MFEPRFSVRARILVISLLPCVTLLAVGTGIAGSLVLDGCRGERWASYLSLIGFYRNSIENLTRGRDSLQSNGVRSLMATPAWERLMSMETALARRAVAPGAKPKPGKRMVHIIAELVDNATFFSPAQSRVEVRGKVVGRGLVVEIMDQGLGIPEAERATRNELLCEPPDFDVDTLSGDSRLGLFVVARLAARHGISVRLTESDYGGVCAVVLVPTGEGSAQVGIEGASVVAGPIRRQLASAANEREQR